MRRALVAATVALAGCGGTAHHTTTTVAHRAHTTPAKQPPPPVRHGPRRTAVPILMYHLVNTPPPGTPNAELWVPAASFRAEVQALADAGYHGVTLDQVLANWQHRIALPSKPIVFSFDDGYGSPARTAASAAASWRPAG